MYYDTQYLPEETKKTLVKFIRDNRILLSCNQAIYGMYDAGSIAGAVLTKTLEENSYKEIEGACTFLATVFSGTSVPNTREMALPQDFSLQTPAPSASLSSSFKSRIVSRVRPVNCWNGECCESATAGLRKLTITAVATTSRTSVPCHGNHGLKLR